MSLSIRSGILALSVAGLSACTTAEPVQITEIVAENLPASVRTVILAERPDFTILDVLKKVRDGRTYYDVEGEVGDGSELEFDILMTETGAQIVEVQRDLNWDDLNADIQAATLKAMSGEKPVRIIESVQTDGAVIYELFAAGKPRDPAQEIRVRAGKIEHLAERWVH